MCSTWMTHAQSHASFTNWRRKFKVSFTLRQMKKIWYKNDSKKYLANLKYISINRKWHKINKRNISVLVSRPLSKIQSTLTENVYPACSRPCVPQSTLRGKFSVEKAHLVLSLTMHCTSVPSWINKHWLQAKPWFSYHDTWEFFALKFYSFYIRLYNCLTIVISFKKLDHSSFL